MSSRSSAKGAARRSAVERSSYEARDRIGIGSAAQRSAAQAVRGTDIQIQMRTRTRDSYRPAVVALRGIGTAVVRDEWSPHLSLVRARRCPWRSNGDRMAIEWRWRSNGDGEWRMAMAMALALALAMRCDAMALAMRCDAMARMAIGWRCAGAGDGDRASAGDAMALAAQRISAM